MTAEIIATTSASLAADEQALADKVAIFGSLERYRDLLPAESGKLLGSIESSRRLISDVEADPAKWDARHGAQQSAAEAGDVLGSLFGG